MIDVRNKKLLVVEDEIFTALTESTMLKTHGYDVQAVSNGEQAGEIIRSNSEIGLVLVELNPGSGIGGLEASWCILEIRELPVIFFTSYMEREVMDQLWSVKRYGYVIKRSGGLLLIASVEMALELFASGNNIDAGELEALNSRREAVNAEFLSACKSVIGSEKKYKPIVGNSHDGIVIANPSFKIIFTNNRITELTGYSKDEITGISCSEIFTESERESIINRHVSRKKGNKEPVIYKSTVQRKDGAMRSGDAVVINPDTSIIALTSHVRAGSRERCIMAGMMIILQNLLK